LGFSCSQEKRSGTIEIKSINFFIGFDLIYLFFHKL